MTRSAEFSVQLALAGFAILMCASLALAHCFPDQTTPSAGSALSAAPPQVVVHFDNEFNPASTSIRVLNDRGDLVSAAGEPSSDHRTITVPLQLLSPGQYFVKWRAVSQDGDHTMGAYSFTFKGASR
jgi:methionine-rich copper-binding protein CopC